MQGNDNKRQQARIKPTNLAELEDAVKDGGDTKPFDALLTAIAGTLDELANGADVYILIGATRDGNSLVFNLKGTDGPGAVYAKSLKELGPLAYMLYNGS